MQENCKAERPPTVLLAVDRLGELSKGLHDVVERMDSRFSPVLLSQPPTVSSDSEVAPQGCTLGNELTCLILEFQSALQKINSIYERCDL